MQDFQSSFSTCPSKFVEVSLHTLHFHNHPTSYLHMEWDGSTYSSLQHCSVDIVDHGPNLRVSFTTCMLALEPEYWNPVQYRRLVPVSDVHNIAAVDIPHSQQLHPAWQTSISSDSALGVSREVAASNSSMSVTVLCTSWELHVWP